MGRHVVGLDPNIHLIVCTVHVAGHTVLSVISDVILGATGGAGEGGAALADIFAGDSLIRH